MADKTKIEWTDATWNPLRGCSRVSEGCRHCYAETVAARFSGPGQPYEGLAQRVTRPDGSTEARWTGKVQLVESMLDQPLRWRRPRRIFVNSMSDLFHESVPDEWIDKVFAVMDLAPQHTFQVLTKRPERMREFLTQRRSSPPVQPPLGNGLLGYMPYNCEVLPPRHIWLGVSVEDQPTADARIPILLDTPAAVRWISAEPLLGPVDLTWIAEPDEEKDGVIDALLGANWIDGMGRGTSDRPMRPGHQDRIMTRYVTSSIEEILAGRRIDWVVAGGESGPRARPMHPAWARALRDQCAAAGTPFLFKQWGEWAPVDDYSSETQEDFDVRGLTMDGAIRVGKARAGRLLDGVLHDAYPAVP